MFLNKVQIYLSLILTFSLLSTSVGNIVHAQSSTGVSDVHNLIACGLVIAKNNTGYPDVGGPVYTIKIENYYQGNTTNSTLTAIGSEDSNGPRGMNPISVDQTALFYVSLGEKHAILLPQTTVVPKCNSVYVPTPLGQYRFGVNAQNVYCLNGYNLVIKSEDGSPACVKPDTANILIERGWAKSVQ